MISRLPASEESARTATAVASALRRCLGALFACVCSAAFATTPSSGVTTFNALPTQTIARDLSAGSPGATATDVSGWDFTALSPTAVLANVDVRDGTLGTGNGVAISRSDYTSADFNIITVSANDRSTFDLRSVGVNVQLVQGTSVITGHSVALIGLDGAGNAIPGATQTATMNAAQLFTFDVSANLSFAGISAFRLVPVTAGDSIGAIFIDDINTANFAALDNIAPNPPSTPHLAPGSDSGASGSDNLTNISTPTFTGTAEAASMVKLYDTDGLTVVGTATANGGTWTITASRLAQGNHTITAKATDAAGNVSVASPGLTLTIDTIAPAVSSVLMPASGSYGEGDNLDFTVTFSKNITVTTNGGTPYIGINIDTGGAAQATFLYGSGTPSLTFRYTVQNGNFDANGITVAGAIALNGGTLKDPAGNNAVTTLTGIGPTAGVRIDATPPTVASISRVQGTPTNLASLSYLVTFSKPVIGVDVSDFSLTTTGTVSALNLNVAPVTTSTYNVTVSSITGAGTLRLDLRSSGTGITDLAANPISSGYTAGQSYAVDRVAPFITNVGIPANGTYLGAQLLTFTLTYSEPVTVITTGGTPRFPITLDTGGTVNATYASGSGTATLIFRYTILSGNGDTNGISVAAAIQNNGGTIRDLVGNDAIPTLSTVPSTTGVLVDAIVPVVTGVTLPASGTHTAGQTLDFSVNYSEPIVLNTTGGVPYLSITLDTGGTVRAPYLSGSGSTLLTFRYTVQSGNADPNGILLAANITPNGATLRDVSGNNATLGLNGIGVTSGIIVDAIAPAITSINRQSPVAAATNVNTVVYRVTFSEAVTGVDLTDFTLTTSNGVTGVVSSVIAVSGAIYDVTVASLTGEGAARLDLKATATGISDLAGNSIPTGALGTQQYTIDTVAPTIISVTPPPNGTYKFADTLDFAVILSEPIAASGSLRLPLTLDTGGTVYAIYASGTGTAKLVFKYTVGVGTLDPTGISIGSSLELNGGTLADPAGNSANLLLNNIGDTTGVLIDGIAPTVINVTGPAGGTYKLGSSLDFTVTLSESVLVTGTPRLNISLDTGGTASALYFSGSGTTSLVFRYTVAAGQYDRTGIVVGPAIIANGGALRDSAGNPAVLTLNNVTPTLTVLVDGIVPTVASIVRVGNSASNAASLAFDVIFSEGVTGVTPAAFVVTASGTVNATVANVVAASNTKFQVTLAPVTGDGTLRLDLMSSGTGIADLAGNAIVSGYTSGDVDTVDHGAPGVTGVSVPTDGLYATGQKLDFTVRLTEPVVVSTIGGTPFLSLALDTGAAVRAAYISGSGTNALLFRYIVAAGNLDDTGIALGGSITPNGGTLRDPAGNDLNPTLNGAASTVGILIDALAPTVFSITAPANATYIKDAALTFTVTYSEPVTVSNSGGIPAIPITLSTGGPAQAAYFSGSGTSTILFRYVVTAGQQDGDGIQIGSSVSLNGGTIRDAAGNDASLVVPTINTTGILIDGITPSVVSIGRNLPNHATTSQSSVKFRVTFNKDVHGVDSMALKLTTTLTAGGTIGDVAAVNGKVYDVTINNLSFGGTLRLDVNASSAISDAAGNFLTSAFLSGETYTLVNNRQPTFTPGSDLIIGQDAGAQIISQWAKNISAGAPGEASQSLKFFVSVDRPSLFSVVPAIAPDGTLTFTPNPAASGAANMTVILLDDSDANNASEPATATIELTSFRGKIGTYNGLVTSSAESPAGNDKAGVLRVVIGKTGAFTGTLRLATSTFVLRGSFDGDGVASFGVPRSPMFTQKRKALPALGFSMLLDVSGNSETLTGTLTEAGAAFASITADRALYVATPNPVLPYENVPQNLLGRYTVVFAAKTPAEQGIAAEEFPQGDGCALLSVGANGVVRLTGTLADGTAVSCSNSLSKANVWPFYVPLSGGQGSLSAAISFRDHPSISDLDATDVPWYKPGASGAKRYPGGWPAGIRVDFLGSKYVTPVPASDLGIFANLAAKGSPSSAMISLTQGNIPAPGLDIPVQVSPTNLVNVAGDNATRLILTLLFPYDPLAGTAHKRNRFAPGLFSGSFTHPVEHSRCNLKGVIFQKQQTAFGYFVGPTQCGAVTLTPQ